HLQGHSRCHHARWRKPVSQKLSAKTCLTMRALTPQGAAVRFPPHDKRKTRTPHCEVRWIKRGTIWTLSEKNVSFVQPLEKRESRRLRWSLPLRSDCSTISA